MKRYTVVWTPSAESDLANIWNNSFDQGGVSNAANSIDYILARDPFASSESRDDNNRIMIVQPLVVVFKVEEPGLLGDRVGRVGISVRSREQFRRAPCEASSRSA